MRFLLFLLIIAGLTVVGLVIFDKNKKGPPQQQFTPQQQPQQFLPAEPQPVFPPQENNPVIQDKTYEGTWVTGGARKRHLNGTMSCDLKNLGNNRYSGRFYGVWEGRKFTYNVEFSGPPENLVGKAIIDGTSYDWSGTLTPVEFNGKFTSRPYDGDFKLRAR